MAVLGDRRLEHRRQAHRHPLGGKLAAVSPRVQNPALPF